MSDQPRRASNSSTEGPLPAGSAGAKRRGLRVLWLVVRSLLQLLLVILLLLGLVLGTQTGLRVAIAVAEDAAPGVLEVGEVDGRILGELWVRDFKLKLPKLELALGRLHLDWSPVALLRGRLDIADLSVRDVDISAEPSPKKSEPFELPQIKLPIGIDIGRILVERLRFNQTNAPPETAFVLDRAELSATAVGDRIDLRRLQARLSQPDVRASAIGSAHLTGAYPIDVNLDWQFHRPPALALTGHGTVAGDLGNLVVQHRIGGSAELTLDAQIRSILSAPAWQGRIDVEQVKLPEIVADAPPLNLQAKLRTSGNLEDAELTGTLQATPAGDASQLPEFGLLAADLDLGWSEQILTIETLTLDETKSGAKLDLTGTLDLNGKQPAFAVAGAWERLRWPLVGDAVAESPLGKLDAKGKLDDFSYSLSAEAFGRQIPEAKLQVAGTGNNQSTRLEILTVDTLGGRISGKGTATWAPSPSWDLALSATDIDPGQQWAGLDGRVGLKADSTGGLAQGFAFNAKLDAALNAYPAAVVNLSGSGHAERATLKSLGIETLGGLIEGSGELAWAPSLSWDLRLDASDLDPGRHYPGLDGRVGLNASTRGGLADGFAYQVKGRADLTAYPPSVLDISGTGTAEATKIETIAIQLLGGRIDGSADLAWSPQLSWSTALTLADLDPGKLSAEWPGRIGGRINSSGKLTDAGPELTARISDLGGELRGYPVRVVADVGMRGKTVDLRQLQASSGDTRLNASGRVDQQLALAFDFDSPDLGALLPDAKGRLSAKGKVDGSLAAPTLALTLDGHDLERAGQGIERISGRADVGLGAGGPFSIDIQGANLVAGHQSFDKIAINGDGSMDSHRLKVSLNGEPMSLDATADGALGEDGAYRGGLKQFSLATGAFGTWRLQRRADYSIDQGHIAAGPFCIGNGQQSGGCVAFEQQQPGVFDASLDVDRIDLDILNPLLPELTAMHGLVRAKGRFQGADQVLTGNASVQVPNGDIQVALPDTKDKLVFSGARLDVRSGATGLDATLALPVQDTGRVDGKLFLPGFRLAGNPEQALRGSVDLRLTNLARVSALAPDITNVTGGIDGNLTLGGSLSRPDLRGRVAIRQVGFQVPLYGLEVAQTDITAETRGANDLSLSGGALVGGGRLNIEGSAAGGAGGPMNLQFQLSGDRLKVADSKEYFALLSLNLRGGFGPGGGSLQGEIKVPKARIMPRTVPAGAIQPSADVVMEDQATQKESVPLAIDVLAKLGDAVKIEAFGLRGQLRGDLRIIKPPNKGLVGDGQLEVVDGTYRVSLPGLGLMTAIGKPLTIEQGIVVFAKTPIDNPGLILNAQREGGDITAGVRVLGTLRNPKLAFFSESDPDLTQAEITRYLVTGVPPKRDAEADERALSVGTYVAPKLFVEYESSLGEQSDRVKIRYDLSKHVEVQTETGDSQGADVFYKFEN